MKYFDVKKVDCLNSKFEKRLFYLVKQYFKYLQTGNYLGIFPALFSCLVCCWCCKPIVKRVFNKSDVFVLYESDLLSLYFMTKDGFVCNKDFVNDSCFVSDSRFLD